MSAYRSPFVVTRALYKIINCVQKTIQVGYDSLLKWVQKNLERVEKFFTLQQHISC